MTDRVYPSANPTSKPTQTLNGSTKPQLYRPTYRPQQLPKPRRSRSRSRRSLCCVCFLYTSLLIIALIILAAIAGSVLWFLYNPQRPTFSLTTLRISQFNLTTSKDSSSHLNSNLDLTISARNPNKKVIFFYDPISVSVKSNGVDIGDGSVPSFVHGTKNTTILKASVISKDRDLDDSSVTRLSSDLKKKSGLALEINLETNVKVKIGGFKSKSIGIKVTCDGIRAIVSKGKSSSTSSNSNAKCKLHLRIKIWNRTF